MEAGPPVVGDSEPRFNPAFEKVGELLTEKEAILVEVFVPVAANEAGGFAGFRETATKTMSLLDRLKAISLPDPNTVADDLLRYVETKERADELDEKIEKTDWLIDEMVFRTLQAHRRGDRDRGGDSQVVSYQAVRHLSQAIGGRISMAPVDQVARDLS